MTDPAAPEKLPMTVALADGLFWNAGMRRFPFQKWYADLTETSVEEDEADGIPALLTAIRFANSRGIMASA